MKSNLEIFSNSNHNLYGLISMFLRAIVQQTDRPIERTDNPTFRVNRPTKPILAVFSPANCWSYSPVGLSTRCSSPIFSNITFVI